MTATGTRAAGARLREAILVHMAASPEHPWTAFEIHEKVVRLGSISNVSRALWYLGKKGLLVVTKGDFHYEPSTYRVVEPVAQERDGRSHSQVESNTNI